MIAKVYAELIRKGKKTLKEVPESVRKQVRVLLKEREKQ